MSSLATVDSSVERPRMEAMMASYDAVQRRVTLVQQQTECDVWDQVRTLVVLYIVVVFYY